MDLTPEACALYVSVLVSVLIFFGTYLVTRWQDRHVANRESYQRLELASIELFRFEAENLSVIRPLWELDTPVPKEKTAERVGFINYVCQMLNLFEIAIRFRRQNIMPPEVFGSWVIWFYNVANAPRFSQAWEEVRSDYTEDLRTIMDTGEWLVVNEKDEKKRKQDFFQRVGEQFNCGIITGWLMKVSQDTAATTADLRAKAVQKSVQA